MAQNKILWLVEDVVDDTSHVTTEEDIRADELVAFDEEIDALAKEIRHLQNHRQHLIQQRARLVTALEQEKPRIVNAREENCRSDTPACSSQVCLTYTTCEIYASGCLKQLLRGSSS